MGRDDDLTYRQPPRSLEAEQALLGAILVNNEAHDRVSGFLEPQHFFDPLHGAIYEAAATLIAAGNVANPITLKTFFEGAEPVGNVPVPIYLGHLAANATSIINARDYARTIRDHATRRGLIEIGETIVNAAYDSPVDFPPKEQIEEAEARLYALVERGERENVEVSAAEMYAAAIGAIQDAYRNRGTIRGLSTGLRDLDAKLNGLRPGRLYIIAGRPAMGKTALAGNIVYAQTEPVHFFSLEMAAEEIGTRLLSADTDLPADQLDKGDVDDAGWHRLITAQQRLSGRTLIVDPSGGLTIGQLAARARRIKRQKGTTLILVDYLQLMRGVKRTESRNLEVGEITAGLKALAKELSVPVVALSQLSRDVEKRGDRRPHLADLRDSGSIEQDADAVIFLFREEYYLERTKPEEGTPDYQDWLAKMQLVAGKAEAIIAKHRHGPVGIAELHFNASLTRFFNLAREGQAQP